MRDFLENIDDLTYRKALRSACAFQGGIKGVAHRAQIHDSNLSKWFRGGKTVSDEAAIRLMEAMGLPDGNPQKVNVFEWNINWMRDDFSKGIEVYFPNGGQVARASWSKWGSEAIMKQLTLSRFGKGNNPPEIYALTDGTVKASIRRTPGLPIALGDFGKKFKWRGGEIDAAVLNISNRDTAWTDGGVSIQDFDKAWETKSTSAEDIYQYLRGVDMIGYELYEYIKKNYPRNK